MMEGMSLITALVWEVAIHIAMECIVDRTPRLREICRGNTMNQIEHNVRSILGHAIRESVNADSSKSQ
jgi:hypothetical protein